MPVDRLPKDSLTFIERFGSRARAYLSQERWPVGFCCRVSIARPPVCSHKNFV
jgi:hypothetical protein